MYDQETAANAAMIDAMTRHPRAQWTAHQLARQATTHNVLVSLVDVLRAAHTGAIAIVGRDNFGFSAYGLPQRNA